jgi:hypothetical protein
MISSNKIIVEDLSPLYDLLKLTTLADDNFIIWWNTNNQTNNCIKKQRWLFMPQDLSKVTFPDGAQKSYNIMAFAQTKPNYQKPPSCCLSKSS